MNDGCEQPGDLRKSKLGNLFFRHLVNQECPGETEEHRLAKMEIATLVRANDCPANVEKYEPALENDGENSRIDVGIQSRNGRRWAIEIQRSGQTIEETHNRTLKLQGLGYDVIWIFFKPQRKARFENNPGAMHLFFLGENRETLNFAGSTKNRTPLISTASFVERLCYDEIAWRGRGIMQHHVEGAATVKSFTCTCKTVSHYPRKAPKEHHVLICGAPVNRHQNCFQFDYWNFLRDNPESLPGGFRLCKIILSSNGRTYGRCPNCDSPSGWIHSARQRRRDGQGNPYGVSPEPPRFETEFAINYVLKETEHVNFGHWCGLGSMTCPRQAQLTRIENHPTNSSGWAAATGISNQKTLF